MTQDDANAVFSRTYYGAAPSMMEGASNQELRDRHLVDGIFQPGKIILTYSHGERFIIGGAVPGANPIALPIQPEINGAAGHPMLERRELGVVNIGEPGTVTVDGEVFPLAKYEALYVTMGPQNVEFAGEGARFYLLSVPAHRAFTTRKLTLADASPIEKGCIETSNERTIYQMVLPGMCDSASLCMGLTILAPGSVWNTMPPHTHERRSEIYLYFDLGDDDRVFHYMGLPDDLRHIVVRDSEAVISPPWSVHMGSGTKNYAFVWAMAGENLDYTDMDLLDICQLR